MRDQSGKGLLDQHKHNKRFAQISKSLGILTYVACGLAMVAGILSHGANSARLLAIGIVLMIVGIGLTVTSKVYYDLAFGDDQTEQINRDAEDERIMNTEVKLRRIEDHP